MGHRRSNKGFGKRNLFPGKSNNKNKTVKVTTIGGYADIIGDDGMIRTIVNPKKRDIFGFSH